MMSPSSRRIPIAAIITLCLLGRASAWGKLGHQSIANVAWDLMNEGTQLAIRTVLVSSQYPIVHTLCDETCSPMAFIADWADEARYSKQYHWSGELHFVDVQDDQLPSTCGNSNNSNSSHDALRHDWRPECGFTPSRDCVDDMCVAGAIVNYTQQLLTRKVGGDDDDDNAYQLKVALMFVAHFVGDIHQPLHVSRKTDRGGNDIAVHVENWTSLPKTAQRRSPLRNYHGGRSSSGIDKKHHGLNLHAVWDDSIIEAFIELHSNQSHSSAWKSWMETTTTTKSLRPYRPENRTILELAIHDKIQKAQHELGTISLWMACPHGHLHACANTWAQESWTLAQEFAYVHVDGRRPVLPNDSLPLDYFHHNLPIVLDRLAIAAVRLAATLQFVFSSSPQEWKEL